MARLDAKLLKNALNRGAHDGSNQILDANCLHSDCLFQASSILSFDITTEKFLRCTRKLTTSGSLFLKNKINHPDRQEGLNGKPSLFSLNKEIDRKAEKILGRTVQYTSWKSHNIWTGLPSLFISCFPVLTVIHPGRFLAIISCLYL